MATPSAVVVSTYQKKAYVSRISREELKDSPWWNRKSEELPLAVHKAVSLAEKAVRRIVPDEEFASIWNLISILLSFCAIEDGEPDRCYYVVRWRGKRSGSKKEGDLWRDQYDEFRIVVLMNGKVVTPEPLASGTSPEERAPRGVAVQE
jgi:hypothetical protein